jgi:hypothetical protein
MWFQFLESEYCGWTGDRIRNVVILEEKFKKTIVFGNIISLVICNTSEYCSVTINVYNKAVTCNTYLQFGG